MGPVRLPWPGALTAPGQSHLEGNAPPKPEEMQIPAWGIAPGCSHSPSVVMCSPPGFALCVCGELEGTVGMPGRKRAEKGELQSATSSSEGSAPMNGVHSKLHVVDA